jgi:thiol:disulfide interchange protein DsbC
MNRRIASRVLTSVLLLASATALGSPQEEIAGMLPGLTAEDVRESPLPGLYEVAVGSQIVYISADRRYLFKGDIIDLSSNESLTEERRNGLRLTEVGALDEKSMVIFEPETVKHTITVFTDVDCTYCRKLHQEIDQLEAAGIRVRYMFYPRYGPGSPGWNKAEAVWCSDDRQAALTLAKSGGEVVAKACGETPIASHFDMGNRIGVRGTPAILLEDGTLMPGYVPAPELSRMLDKG